MNQNIRTNKDQKVRKWMIEDWKVKGSSDTCMIMNDIQIDFNMYLIPSKKEFSLEISLIRKYDEACQSLYPSLSHSVFASL